MYQFILSIHVIVSIILIGIILLQEGKGGATAGLGGGTSQGVFGSKGSASILVKITGYLAVAFFVLSIMLGYLANQATRQSSELPAPVTEQVIPQPSNNAIVEPGQGGGLIPAVPVE